MRRFLAVVVLASALLANPSMPVLPVEVEPIDSVGDLIARIRNDQHVTENSGIKADRVSDAILVELGRLVMDDQLGTNPVRVWLDTMMGGTASQAHRMVRRQIGYNYLRGRTGRFPGFTTKPFGRQARVVLEPPATNAKSSALPPERKILDPGSVLVAAVFLAQLLVLVLLLFEYRRRGRTQEALGILEKRYAQGEIDAVEFEQRRIALTERPRAKQK